MKDDPIIDKSPDQKRKRIEALRLELHDLGFSVVPTEWLKQMFWEFKQRQPDEKAKHPRSHRSQEAMPRAG